MLQVLLLASLLLFFALPAQKRCPCTPPSLHSTSPGFNASYNNDCILHSFALLSELICMGCSWEAPTGAAWHKP